MKFKLIQTLMSSSKSSFGKLFQISHFSSNLVLVSSRSFLKMKLQNIIRLQEKIILKFQKK